MVHLERRRECFVDLSILLAVFRIRMDPGFFADPDPGFKSPDPGFKSLDPDPSISKLKGSK